MTFGAPQCDLAPTHRASGARATDAPFRDNTPPTRACLDLKPCRWAGKDIDQRQLDQVDEPGAQRAPQGQCLKCQTRDRRTAHGVESSHVESVVHNGNGECVRRAKSFHSPDRSPRSSYATDDRWGGSKHSHPPLRSPRPTDPAILRLAVASLSPACQQRMTHLSARARACSIEFERCTGTTQKGRAAQPPRRGALEAARARGTTTRFYYRGHITREN